MCPSSVPVAPVTNEMPSPLLENRLKRFHQANGHRGYIDGLIFLICRTGPPVNYFKLHSGKLTRTIYFLITAFAIGAHVPGSYRRG